jgi:Xaa-Pro aminopeptidase
MNRRDFFTATAGTLVLTNAAAADHAASKLPSAAEDERLQSELRNAPLMNLDRARELLEAAQLDGLVLMRPDNVFHVANFWPLLDVMGNPPSTAVLVPRDPRLRPALVVPQFTYYYVYSDAGPREYLDHYLYTAPEPGAPQDAIPKALPPTVFEARDPTRLSMLERRRRRDLDPFLSELAPGLARALLSAARDLGLDRGRVGVDADLPGDLLGSVGAKTQTIPADQLIHRIRLVKSPLEIEIASAAATRNSEAALAAAAQARSGMSLREFRRTFMAEASRRGLTPVFMVVDRVSNELYDAPLREGSSFLIDCVSQLQHYHGDFGRTVVIGETTAAIEQATAAMAEVWSEIRSRLRPGLRYSDIRRIGSETLAKLGGGPRLVVNPHNVGLYHTDEPRDTSGATPTRMDLALEAGMILSVDCPLFEDGLGGSAHLEDLTLITADGSRPIHPVTEAVIRV